MEYEHYTLRLKGSCFGAWKRYLILVSAIGQDLEEESGLNNNNKDNHHDDYDCKNVMGNKVLNRLQYYINISKKAKDDNNLSDIFHKLVLFRKGIFGFIYYYNHRKKMKQNVGNENIVFVMFK